MSAIVTDLAAYRQYSATSAKPGPSSFADQAPRTLEQARVVVALAQNLGVDLQLVLAVAQSGDGGP